MKKRMTAIVVAGVTAAMLLAGCQTKELSNEYVTISEYKGVEITKIEKVEVTDEDVETEIQAILDTYSTTEEVTGRAAELGDIANIDYVGKKDDVAFDGGTAEGYDLELGSGTFIDGFEDGIVGYNVGETFDLNLTFPETYYSEDLAGQEVVFTVTLNSLSVVVVPELTDEFVKENLSAESETVEEYKAEIKAELQELNDEDYETSLRNAAWSAILENATINEYPEDAVQEYVDILYSEYETMASYYGMEFADFLTTYMGMDEETFAAQVEEVGQAQVKSDLVRDLLVENVNVDTSEAVFEAAYEEYAEYYGYETVEDFLSAMETADNKDYLDRLILLEIVQDWVVDNCKQVEATAE